MTTRPTNATPTLESSVTVAQYYQDKPGVRTSLVASFPHVEPHHVVVNLSACLSVAEVVAPAPAHVLCNCLDSRFSTLTTSVLATSTRNPSLLFLRDAHLIGVVIASSRGHLRLHSPPSAHRTPLLIAPPPPPNLYNAPVYISDWRHLPATDGAPALLEVLLRDIHVLVAPPAVPQSHVLSSTLALPKKSSLAISGVISAKSHLLGPQNGAGFIVELVSPRRDAAVAIVFSGSAISWWPFLPVGGTVVMSNLRVSALTSEPTRQILATRSSTVVYTTSSRYDASSSPVVPPGRTLCPLRRALVPNTVADYEGIVTRHLPPGVLLLDGTVALHLSEFDMCLAGRIPARAFRPGTRIRASHVVVVVRPAAPPRLFATTRTIVDVLYFADVRKPNSQPRPAAWIRLCRRLSLPSIAYAEELFDAFVQKFHTWLDPMLSQASQPCTTSIPMSQRWSVCSGSDIAISLLGDDERPGLIQFVMRLLGDDDDILHAHSLPLRNVCREFLMPPIYAPNDFTRPCVPTFANVRETLSLLCSDAARANGGAMFGAMRTFQTIFDDEDVARKLATAARTPGAPSLPNGIALVGLLQGVANGRGLARLIDGTDALDVRCVPFVQPSLLGAMVCVSKFTAVVDIREECGNDVDDAGRSLHITLTCHEDDFQVVVDGPCVDMHRDKSGSSVPRDVGLDVHQRTHEVFTQSAVTASCGGPPNGADAAVVDVPLICLFVETVARGSASCMLTGRLIGFVASRSDEAWTIVDCNGKGFWTCQLHLKGDSLLSMVPSFSEGRLYAISCTELDGMPNIKACISRKASLAHQKGHVLKLRSELGTMLPWIENLGYGVYMRFVPDESLCAGHDRLNGMHDWGGSLMSQEGEQYVYFSKAVHQFRTEILSKVESKVWRLYEWSDHSDIQDKKMSACGIVTNVESMVEGGWSSTDAKCILDKLTITDEVLGLFSVTVSFYDSFALIRGVSRGMRVLIRNFVRVTMESRTDRFEFVANAETSVSILARTFAIATDSVEEDGCTCHSQFGKSFKKASQHLEMMYIDEFMGRGGPAAGIVRFSRLKVEWLRLRLKGSQTTCKECSVSGGDEEAEDEENSSSPNPRRAVMAEVILLVDDGSRAGLLRCRGFGPCARLLGAQRAEQEAMKRLAVAAGDVQSEVINGPSFFYARFPRTSRDDAYIVWAMIQNRREASFLAAVLNRAAVNERVDGRFTRLVPSSYRFGYGRSVVIARPPLSDRVMLECVALFEENRTFPVLPSAAEHSQKNSVSALEILNKLVFDE